MYYYQTDLRTPTLGNCTSGASGNILCSTPTTAGDPDPYNNVFQSATDKNNQQHMTTFTLGLGASGWMNYSPGYEKGGTNADYDAVKLGRSASSTVCKWQASGTCNWPIPGEDSGGNGYIANIDDLWHAAVDGGGIYFSATNPDTLSSGLANALASIKSKQGAAAAAATSTLNPVAGNNFAYVASYTTVNWNGNLEARGINTDTGVVNENATWCVEDVNIDPSTSCATPVAQTSGDTIIYNCETPSSGICSGGVIGCSGDIASCIPAQQVCKVPTAKVCTGTMNAKVAATTDTRTIVTANATGTALMNFDTTYATANPSYFNTATVSALSQWSSLDSSQQSRAVGANLLNYLRGQSGFENRPSNVTGSGSTIVDNELFRARTAVLGDALESQPAFISAPVFSYPYPGYSAFKTAQASRAGTVYMGTNDGMMHAFAADTGIERWAYVPSMVIPNMWKLADFNYGTLHNNFVNGSPITSDVCTANCTTASATWKTILVAGLNGGGRGYYALDITDPTTPTLLWELTTTAGIGKTKDDDLGYSYGQPVITKKADGTWVVLVTSGYNNIPGSDSLHAGKGYLYVLNAGTGAMISKISTGVGSATTPSGLAKIAGFNNEPPGNAVSYVYGGDLQGDVWRFDINDTTTTADFGTGAAFKFATLFSDNAASNPQPITTTPVLGKIAGNRVVFIGTGKYLEVGDLTTTQTQTEYAIKDDNSGVTFVNPRSQTTLMVNQTMTTNVANGTRSVTNATPAPNFNTGRGWFVDFPESGERVNIDSQLVLGVLIVPTIVPSNTACSPGGHGWLNFLDYKTGGAVTSSGLVSAKYDSTIVGVNVLYIDGAPVVEVVTSTDPTPNKDNDVTFPPTAGSFTGKRTLWRELIQ
jgi:type IV pilus assembly protein PilY1